MYEYLNQFKWCYSNGGYAVRGIGPKGKTRLKFLHHYILPKINEKDIDHINKNKLDNRKENLRYATRSENMFNVGIRKNNTSGFNGVFYFKFGKRIKRWKAQLKINYQSIHLGYFLTKEEAGMAYEIAFNEYKKDPLAWVKKRQLKK